MTTICIVGLVLVWLGYLIPWFTGLHRNDEAIDLADPLEQVGESMTSDSVVLVRRSADFDSRNPELDVSTPFTRAAALRELRRSAHLAAVRRRRLLVGLAVAIVAVAVATPFTALPAWSVLVPITLFVVSLGVCRFSVKVLDASFARQRDQIRAAWENETLALAMPMRETSQTSDALDGAELENTEYSIELTAPITAGGSLWEPIPVIAPSYVSKPLVPRTVRTIDLSAPAAPIVVPPTAEAPIASDAPVQAGAHAADADIRRAVGE